MSRGFRDSDATQELSAREADEAIKRVKSAGERQAKRAAELREIGEFGLCESCGRPIGDERLAAVPDATHCISCQARWENAQVRG
jgi:RNA polymerase-binding transcription factor